LAELIIAVAILSVGITVVISAFSFSAQIAGFSKDLIEAVLLSEDTFQFIEFKERRGLWTGVERIEEARQADKFELYYRIDPKDTLSLKVAEVSVRWPYRKNIEQLALTTYLR